MLALNPKYLVDEGQHPQAVQLSMAEWEQIVKALEELEDIRVYDRAKSGDCDSIPFEQAVREIEKGYET